VSRLLKSFGTAFTSYVFILKYAAIYLLFTALLRIILMQHYHIGVDNEFFLTLLYGIRMDIIIYAVLIVIPVLFFALNRFIEARFMLALIMLLLFIAEIMNFLFFEEFEHRLDYKVVEYLDYPEAIFHMILVSYRSYFLIALPLLLLGTYWLYRSSSRMFAYRHIASKLVALPLVLGLLFLGIRSSVDHSTPNPSFYSFSNASLKNEIANNSLFSLQSAIVETTKERWPRIGPNTHDNIAKMQRVTPIHYESNSSMQHSVVSSHFPKKHMVLVIIESFGNSHLGILGGTPTSPYFDAMSREGLFASNMYSSAGRSNRGIEAILSSVFPVISETYLKLPQSKNNFWTVASTMKRHGYKNMFVYSGDSKFDNIKGFVISNGFDAVFDQNDFDSKWDRYTWGVNDEALYAHALDILRQSKEPLFLVLYTVSSHKPFDYPADNITLYDKAPKASFPNAIKYADYALHGFYKALQNEHFFEDSALVITADHNSKISGKYPVPVNEYRIPALFIAKDITPRTLSFVTHHADIAPTLLDLAGVSDTIPAQGVNLFEANASQAVILNHQNFAYVHDKGFVLYPQDKSAACFSHDYTPRECNASLETLGRSVIYGTQEIYENRRHQSTVSKK
jgi:phosphoglycerol transferase MdoB-like AlkP superfamily enzyme